MAISLVKYQLPRGLKTLSIDIYDVVPEFEPELTILDAGTMAKRGIRYIRAYRWCYPERLALDATIRSGKLRNKVNLSSFCPKRAKIVHKIISRGLIGSVNIGLFTHMNRSFDWIDQQERGIDLLTLESAKKLYQDYTDQMLHRVQLSNVGPIDKNAGAIGHATANQNQLSMAFICAAATGVELSTVQSWAFRISQLNKGPSRSIPAPKVTETEHAIAHSLHTRLFTAFSDAILNNTAPPVVVELSDIGFEDLIFYTQKSNSIDDWKRDERGHSSDWKPLFYGRKGVYQGGLKEFNGFLAAHGIDPLEKKLAATYTERQHRAKAFPESVLKYMANTATRHFGYLLLAESGANASTLETVDCSQTKLDKILGAARLLVVKGRAGYEKQNLIISRHFAQTTWRRYLELRDWKVKTLEERGLCAPQNGLFLICKRQRDGSYRTLNAANISTCRLWPKHAPSLATREARKHKTINILENSNGNIALASAMQIASQKTIARHYAFKNLIEATRQMSEYFELQAKSAALRYSGVEPVRIIKDGEDTSTGHCDATEAEGPRRIEGLNFIEIEPHCGAPLTCLFCAHFGLHATDEDLLRLLTIKRWVEVQTRLYASNIDEDFTKYSPYIERIEQVFEELHESGGKFSDLVRRAKARFAEGKRDLYWAAKTNALLDLEAV